MINSTIATITGHKDFFGPGYTHRGMMTAVYSLQLAQKSYERYIHVVYDYHIVAYNREGPLMHQLSPGNFNYQKAIARCDKYGFGTFGLKGDQPELINQAPWFKVPLI